jgi:iron complex transport system substrate-binding protein
MKRNLHKWLFVMLLAATQILLAQADTPPQRIVSLAPHITEIIFRLGTGERLVARSDYCRYPSAALQLPTVGGYLNPDLEKIVSLNPDLVFIFPNENLEKKLTGLQLKAAAIPNETISDILQGIETVGRMLHIPGKAQNMISSIRDSLDTLAKQAALLPSRTALILIGREPGTMRALYAAGKETYLSELLGMLNVKNVFDDVPLRYFEVSKEDLLLRNPDMIIEFRSDGNVDTAALVRDWDQLSTLKAVKQQQIVIFNDVSFLIPGPRIAKNAYKLYQTLSKK